MKKQKRMIASICGPTIYCIKKIVDDYNEKEIYITKIDKKKDFTGKYIKRKNR